MSLAGVRAERCCGVERRRRALVCACLDITPLFIHSRTLPSSSLITSKQRPALLFTDYPWVSSSPSQSYGLLGHYLLSSPCLGTEVCGLEACSRMTDDEARVDILATTITRFEAIALIAAHPRIQAAIQCQYRVGSAARFLLIKQQ